MAKQRSRRLRKKLHVGEFQELGFKVAVRFKQRPTAEEAEAFVDAFLIEAIEPRRLSYAGWAEGGVVAREGRGTVSAQEREDVVKWLRARDEVESAEGGELMDVWYAED